MLNKLIYICFVVILFTACGDELIDPCTALDCGVNGICVDGTCDCEGGYYGDSCENLIQDLFLGIWSGVDCESEDYSIVVVPDSNIFAIIIEDKIGNIRATILDENNFEIPEQEFYLSSINIEVVGFGQILEDGKLKFDVIATPDGQESQSCVILMEKQ